MTENNACCLNLCLNKFLVYPPGFLLSRLFSWIVVYYLLAKLFLGQSPYSSQPVQYQPSVGLQVFREFRRCSTFVMRQVIDDLVVNFVHGKSVRVRLSTVI